MNYTQKLTLSMVIPTVMVAGAGGAVVVGAVWLQQQTKEANAATMTSYLQIGGTLTRPHVPVSKAAALQWLPARWQPGRPQR